MDKFHLEGCARSVFFVRDACAICDVHARSVFIRARFLFVRDLFLFMRDFYSWCEICFYLCAIFIPRAHDVFISPGFEPLHFQHDHFVGLGFNSRVQSPVSGQ